MTSLPPDILQTLADPYWRLYNLYRIMVKGDEGEQDLVVDFAPNRAQTELLDSLHGRDLVLKARQLGFCVSPDTRVLTASLEWVQIGQIQPGTEIIACDEHPPGGRGSARKMRTATVLAVKTMRANRWRITFDDGRHVVCTDRHPWLSRKVATDAKWRSISGDGNSVVGKLTVGTKVRWVAKPWTSSTFEDGWFGGMLDGEGSIAKRNSSAGVNVSQRTGPVWDRLVKYALVRGYKACIENDAAVRPRKHGKVPVPKLAFGRMDEMFRLIGQTRPTRFIDNRFWEGRELPGKRNGGVGSATITNIEEIGEGDVVDMQTTTGTYIAEGFVSHNTTLSAILWLDTALFTANMRCGIIAQDQGAAEVIFRDKVRYGYEHIGERLGLSPSGESWNEVLKRAMPLARDSASELLFDHNNSSIRVATSMRSGTIHRLHVSEYGKICAKYPDKAREVITGSIPAVPLDGIVIIESTAEGQDGDFYKKVQRALAAQQEGRELSRKDFRLHFFPWWAEPGYCLPDDAIPLVPITEKDRKYFAALEAKICRELSAGQKAWYVATRESDFSGEDEKMWQEYPGTPEEAFQVSTEGVYYAEQLANARKGGRICRVPYVDVPVNTFWDVGRSDSTAIWFHQQVGPEHRFIRYHEDSGQTLGTYVKYLQDTGYVFGKHYLPHDAAHKRLSNSNKSIEEMLVDLGIPSSDIIIVDRISDEQVGIQQTRKAFPSCWFDEVGCAQGLQRLGGFKRAWNKTTGAWRNEPAENGCEHGADAFRQFGQALDTGQYRGSSGNSGAQKIKRRGSGMAV